MVEVFKTNVLELCDAEKLLQKIKERFSYCSVNFDLEDCDKILRLECGQELPDYKFLEDLFSDSGFNLEVLSD